MDNAVLLNLTVRVPGNSKRVPTEGVVGDGDLCADQNWISVSKRLLESAEFDGVRRILGQMKRWLERKCIVPRAVAGREPALRRFLKSGVYVLPIGLVAEVDEQIQWFKLDFAEAVDKFLEVYPRLRDAAQEKLKGLFDPLDYPPPETLRRSFSIESSYLTVGTPQALQNVSAEIFKREQEKAQKQWAEASVEIRQVLRAGLQDLVTWMADTLKPGEPGKRQKAFRGSQVEKLMEACGDFGAKDITNDTELAAVVEKIKGILGGESVESLQSAAKDESWRSKMAESFASVKADLEPLVEEGAIRVLTLRE